MNKENYTEDLKVHVYYKITPGINTSADGFPLCLSIPLSLCSTVSLFSISVNESGLQLLFNALIK